MAEEAEKGLVSWKKVGVLFAVDVLVFVAFALWSINNCIMSVSSTVIVVNHELECTLVFLVGLQNLIPYFIVIVLINFALPAIWKVVVKKK